MGYRILFFTRIRKEVIYGMTSPLFVSGQWPWSSLPPEIVLSRSAGSSFH
jgi:hypothetical protein